MKAEELLAYILATKYVFGTARTQTTFGIVYLVTHVKNKQ